jgi:hypothetical protein
MNQEPIGFMFVLHMMTSSRLILLVTDNEPMYHQFSLPHRQPIKCVGRMKDEGKGSVSGLYATHITSFTHCFLQ